jgi:hypothetical protein
MIEAKVLFTYVDKYTGEMHLEGSAVMLEESRAAELKALKAVDFADRPKTEAKEEPKKEEAKKAKAKTETAKKAPSRRKTT